MQLQIIMYQLTGFPCSLQH